MRPVLFVTFTGSRPVVELSRATALAAQLGTSLDVMIVAVDEVMRSRDLGADATWLDTSINGTLSSIGATGSRIR